MDAAASAQPQGSIPTTDPDQNAPLDPLDELQHLLDRVNRALEGGNVSLQDPLMQQEVALQTQVKELVEWRRKNDRQAVWNGRLQDLLHWEHGLNALAKGRDVFQNYPEPYRQQEEERWQYTLDTWTATQQEWHKVWQDLLEAYSDSQNLGEVLASQKEEDDGIHHLLEEYEQEQEERLQTHGGDGSGDWHENRGRDEPYPEIPLWKHSFGVRSACRHRTWQRIAGYADEKEGTVD